MELKDGMYVPVPTDMQPVPEDMLSVIACKCKTSTKNPCSSQICSCRKHGMQYVAACKRCCGKECENVSQHTNTCEASDGDASSFDDDDGMELVDENDGIVNDAWDDERIIDFIPD